MIQPSFALRLENLKKVYGNGHVALKNINLSVEEGDFFALLGRNGAGKSTAIGIISSLVNKTAGRVTIFDTDIDVDFSKAKTYLGVVPQEINFSVFETPLQIVTNQAGYYGMPRRQALENAERYLVQLKLWDKRNGIARELSGGMKRRLMIARALVHEPRLLILDEPTAGVDIEIRRTMWEFLQQINESGTTIILTTHYLEEAESLCRNIGIIDQGELIQNTSKQQLLKLLQQETYILDLAQPMSNETVLDSENFRCIDQNTIELTVKKDEGVSNAIVQLNDLGIQVQSLRNKANRLEQLFMDLLEEGKA